VKLGRKHLLRNSPFRVYPFAPAGSQLPAAVHIIQGDSAGGALKSAGADPLVCVPDDLALGPSSRSPADHRRRRLEYWRQEWVHGIQAGEEEWHDWPLANGPVAAPELARAVFAAERGRVLLWTSGGWNELLFLAWAVDALRRGGIAEDRIGVAGPVTAAFRLAYLNPEQLKSFGAGAVALGSKPAAAAIRLWDAFTSDTPADLEDLRRDRSSPFPTLRKELALYASFLPRAVSRRRRLTLPEVDEALLAALSEREWRSLPNLLRTPPSRARWPTSALFAIIRAYGDLFIVSRLRRWSQSSTAAVECAQLPGIRHPFSFRLTATGTRLLQRGLPDHSVLPPTRIGGHEVGGKHLWVCAVDSAGRWSLRKA